MTEIEIKRIFKLVLAGWPTQRQRLTNDDIAEMAMLYTAGIADLDYEAARAAVVRLARTAKWMPTIADICEAALVVMHGHKRTGAEAWGDVLKAIRRYGWGRSPGTDFQFDDPVVARVVYALGWTELCHSEGAMIAADRARFIEAYEDLRDQARADQASTPGLARTALPAANEKRQLAAPAPVLSAEDRSKSLRAVLEQAIHDNPHLAPELQAINDSVGDIDRPKIVTIAKVVDEVSCQAHGVDTYEDICLACGAHADGPPGIIGRSH